ncbi:MAG: GAF domain-containing sensor histidine kinase [Elusimicrobiota bacterium]
MIKLSYEDFTEFEQALYMMGRLNRLSIEARTLVDFWPVLAESFVAQFRCERATLFLVKNGKLRSQFALGLDEPVELEFGQGMAGRVVQEGKSYLTNDPYNDPRFDASVDLGSGYETKTLLASAFYHDGAAVGVVELLNKPGGFDRDDVRILEWLSPHVGFLLYEMDQAEEKRRLENQVAQSAKMADLGFLVGGVAHDLSNPVMNLLTGADLLMSQTQAGSPARTIVEKIRRNARSCQGILHNLMDLIRKSEFKLEEVVLEEVLRETLDLIDTQARMNKVAVRSSVPGGLPKVNAAKNPLRRVFINLFVNAFHAMPDGGTLDVSAEARDGKVDVRVKDTGVGIEPEYLPRLFDKFFTTRGRKGTGLGLSICRDILMKCGGTLEAHSEGKDKGAVFTLSLPVPQACAAGGPGKSSAPRVSTKQT